MLGRCVFIQLCPFNQYTWGDAGPYPLSCGKETRIRRLRSCMMKMIVAWRCSQQRTAHEVFADKRTVLYFGTLLTGGCRCEGLMLAMEMVLRVSDIECKSETLMRTKSCLGDVIKRRNIEI